MDRCEGKGKKRLDIFYACTPQGATVIRSKNWSRHNWNAHVTKGDAIFRYATQLMNEQSPKDIWMQ